MILTATYQLVKVTVSVILVSANDDHFKGAISSAQVAFIVSDSITCTLWYLYFFYVIFILLNETYSNFRYEFHRHKVWFLASTIVLTLSLPLDIVDFFYFQHHETTDGKRKLQWKFERVIFYAIWVAHTLPTILIMCVRPGEDCLNCFNRI